MSSSFGQVFRISTWGESHGTGVGVVIDGCPSLVPVTEEDIQRELDRRRPGQSDIVTPRREEDRAEILSGVLDGKTLGTPIAISVRNKDHRSSAYDEMASTYRPSHADYTYPKTKHIFSLGLSPRPISICWLNCSHNLHLRPINLVVYKGS